MFSLVVICMTFAKVLFDFVQPTQRCESHQICTELSAIFLKLWFKGKFCKHSNYWHFGLDSWRLRNVGLCVAFNEWMKQPVKVASQLILSASERQAAGQKLTNFAFWPTTNTCSPFIGPADLEICKRDGKRTRIPARNEEMWSVSHGITFIFFVLPEQFNET